MTRSEIFARDGFRCVYCGQVFPPEELSVDHVQPRSRGGDRSGGNLVTACRACNVRKGRRRVAQYLASDAVAHANFRRYAVHVWERHLRALEEEINRKQETGNRKPGTGNRKPGTEDRATNEREMKASRGSDERVVFLLDVDNTLLDNDRVIDDLNEHLQRQFGAEMSNRYWTIFEQLRTQMGYADYLGALQRYRSDAKGDMRLLEISAFLIGYPFEDRLYPGALDVVRRLNSLGTTVILSDGDVVFQPWKVRRSGLWNAVDGRVLIYIHKEEMLEAVEELYPAPHYVMVDDKLRILAAMKQHWGDRLTTIFPRQGHYAVDPRELSAYPRADVTVDRIGDLLSWEPASRA